MWMDLEFHSWTRKDSPVRFHAHQVPRVDRVTEAEQMVFAWGRGDVHWVWGQSCKMKFWAPVIHRVLRVNTAELYT